MITHQPVNNNDDMVNVREGVLNDAGLKLSDTGDKVTFAGLDPIRSTVVKVATGGSILGVADAAALAIIWKMTSGEGQDIHVDLRKA